MPATRRSALLRTPLLPLSLLTPPPPPHTHTHAQMAALGAFKEALLPPGHRPPPPDMKPFAPAAGESARVTEAQVERSGVVVGCGLVALVLMRS